MCIFLLGAYQAKPSAKLLNYLKRKMLLPFNVKSLNKKKKISTHIFGAHVRSITIEKWVQFSLGAPKLSALCHIRAMLRKSPYFWCCTVLGSKKQINRTELMAGISDLDLVFMHSRSTGTWKELGFYFCKNKNQEK